MSASETYILATQSSPRTCPPPTQQDREGCQIGVLGSPVLLAYLFNAGLTMQSPSLQLQTIYIQSATSGISHIAFSKGVLSRASHPHDATLLTGTCLHPFVSELRLVPLRVLTGVTNLAHGQQPVAHCYGSSSLYFGSNVFVVVHQWQRRMADVGWVTIRSLGIQNIMILLLSWLIVEIVGLDCTLYDYSSGSVLCVTSCPSSTTQLANNCCSSVQYLYHSRCQLCQGWVTNSSTSCCDYGQYFNADTQKCQQCSREVFLNGTLCCRGCEYVDMTGASPRCVPVGQGGCPSLTCVSQQRICCGSGGVFNALTNRCTSDEKSLNVDQSRMVGCPNGYFLDYAYKTLMCVKSCTFGVTSGSLLCASKFCTAASTLTLSLQPPSSNLLALSNNRCCYAISNGQCITSNVTCPLRFQYNLFTVCCRMGYSYSLQYSNCSLSCSGVIVAKLFCIPAGGFLDLSQTIPQVGTSNGGVRYCNGRILPSTINICCPLGQFADGIKGCVVCRGNIFGLSDRQVCCRFSEIYNISSQQCSTCQGVVDASGTFCCPSGSYVSYNTNGSVTCQSDCPLENIQGSRFCCVTCSSSCQAKNLSCGTPTLCSSSYFVQNSCNPCSCGICTYNPNCVQCNTTPSSLSSCSPTCPAVKVLDSLTFQCLDCDPSCSKCTLALSSSNCTACSQGYYNNGGTCQMCFSRCLTCSASGTLCTSCYSDGMFPILFSGNCIANCRDGTYWSSNNTCVNCGPNCVVCTGPTICSFCSLNFYSSGGLCLACSAPCKTCLNSSNSCTSCQSGFTLLKSNSSCPSDCPPSFSKVLVNFEMGSVCKPCDPECLSCVSSPIDCSNCIDGHYLNTTLGTSSCFPCPKGCILCLNSTNCLGQCATRYYSPDLILCSPCDVSCYTCNGPTPNDCLSCLPGVTLFQGKCTGCANNCLTCISTQICTSCSASLLLYNGTCILSCPSSTYASGQSCVPCSTDCLSCNSTQCLSCSSNSPVLDQGRCVKVCNSSSYSVGGVCTLCNGTVYNGSASCCVLPLKVIDNKCVNQNTSPTPPVAPNDTRPTPNLTTTSSTIQILAVTQGNKLYITVFGVSNLQENASFILLSPSNSSLQSTSLDVSLVSKSNSSITVVTDAPPPTLTGYLLKAIYGLQTLYSNGLIGQNQINYVKNNKIRFLEVIGVAASAVIILYSILSKLKGHYIAEEANTLILHSLNFVQVSALFQKVALLPEATYSFLKGFRFSHLSFFWNPFNLLIPSSYIQGNQPESLAPDVNFLRQAGFSIAFQLLAIILLLITLSISYYVFYCNRLDEPPMIRKILRIFILLMSICFMNEIFCAVCAVRYHHTVPPNNPRLYSSSFGASVFFLVTIPLLIVGIFVHYYLTYLQNKDEHLYTLRETSQLLQIYFQGVILGLSVSKYTTLFLLGLEAVWILFNLFLDPKRDPMYRIRLYVVGGVVGVGYIFLSLSKSLNVGSVVVVTLVVVSLLVYCTYQVVGLYYWEICGVCGVSQPQNSEF